MEGLLISIGWLSQIFTPASPEVMPLLRIIVGFTLITVLSCSGNTGTSRPIPPPTSPPAPQTSPPIIVRLSEESTTGKSPEESEIRNIDFRNFTFPQLPSGKCSAKWIRLTDGRYDAPEVLGPHRIPSKDCWSVVFEKASYGDVTGDGREEAFVILFAELGGNSSYEDVFVYTLKQNEPRLIWRFMTGDRANGGLRSIFADKGDLVLELYGVGTAIGKNLEGTDDVGACCPKHYTISHYKFNGRQFSKDGTVEVLPNPSETTKYVDH